MSIKIAPADVLPVRRDGRFRTVMVSAALILIAASVAGCSKKVARTPDPRPVRTVTVELAGRRRDRFLHRPDSRSRPGQPGLPHRRADDRAPRQSRGRHCGRPHRGQARLPERRKRAALRPGQPRLGAGDVDPGQAHFRASAGAAEGRLDLACQVRRRPGSPAHGGSTGRVGPGTAPHRRGSAGLHGAPRRQSGRRHGNRAPMPARS